MTSVNLRTAILRITLIYFPFVALLGSIVTIYSGVDHIWKAEKTGSWHKARGTIISSTLNVSTGGRPVYSPRIEYKYEVNGIGYMSDTIQANKITSYGKSHPQKIISKYQQGKEISVYYDPNNHSRAVMIKGVTGETVFPLICGLGLLIFFFILRKFCSKLLKMVNLTN